ncbi:MULTISPECIES: DUF1173 family protein [Enterobacterales]|uniref:DUF1173 family protein n=1 Tax=Enterobacterales TaxID=91347 RepID=UPI002ED78B9A
MIRAVCLVVVSDRWIPLESAHEEDVEEKRVREGQVSSILLTDGFAENEYHPDFIRMDIHGECCSREVWGRDNEEYQAHKIIKINYL